MYHAVAESLLSYGILVWGCAPECFLHSVKILQRKIIKIILGRPPLHSTSLIFEEFRVMNLSQLFAYQIVNYLYNNQNSIRIYQHSHSTRSQNDTLSLAPRANKAIGQANFTYIKHKIFNKLPKEIKNCFSHSHHTFKRMIKPWIMENAIVINEVLH